MEQLSFRNYLNVSDTEEKETKAPQTAKDNKNKKGKSNRSKSRSRSRSRSRNNSRDKRKSKKRHIKKGHGGSKDKKSRHRKDKKHHKRRRSPSSSSSKSSESSSSYSSDESESDSRSRSKSKSMSRSRRRDKHNKRKKYPSPSPSKSKKEEHYNLNNIKVPKWTSAEDLPQTDKKIITVKSKYAEDKSKPEPKYESKSQNKNKIDDIKPNENIPIEQKEKPNFDASGLLAKQTNTVNGIVLKFTEPLDSALPDENWRLYTFKDCTNQDILNISQRSSYLIGKEEKVANILVSHPSCSRQHAVIQFRKISKKDNEGNIEISIKPYVMDLESTNGTHLNKQKIEPARYYELKPLDILNFGHSLRDYVVMKVDKNKDQ